MHVKIPLLKRGDSGHHLTEKMHSLTRNVRGLKTNLSHKYSMNVRREALITQLPMEIVMYIMEFLSLEDLCRALAVCSEWRSLGYAYNEYLWKMQSMNYWENFINRGDAKHCNKAENENWATFFTKRYDQDRRWKSNNSAQSTLTGHAGTVWTLAFDEKKLVTGSFDKTVKIWDRKTYKCLRTLRGHNYPIQCLQFQDNMLVTGSLDNSIRVWDTDTGAYLGSLTNRAHNFDVFCLQFEGDRLVSGSSDSTLKVWNMETLQCEQMLWHASCVTCLQFEGSRLVSGSADKFLKLWDLNTGACDSTLVGHFESIRCLQFTGNALISGSNDHTLKLWDLRTSKCALTLRGHLGGVRCLQFRGNTLLSGSADRTIKLWDVRNPNTNAPTTPAHSPTLSFSPSGVGAYAPPTREILHHSTSVACLQWDGETLISGFSDAKVKVCSF